VRNVLGTLCCIVALGTVRPAAGSQNHLTNAHFNVNLDAWTLTAQPGFSRNWTDAKGHDGAGAAAVYANGATTALQRMYSQCVPVAPGPIQVGAWFRYEGGYGTVPSAELYGTYYSDANCVSPTGSSGASLISSKAPELAGLWQLLTYTDDIGFTKSVQLELWMGVATAQDAQGYFDDAFVSSGTSGDANGDGVVDIGDVFYLLNYLFAGGPYPVGPADVNNSDSLDVSDVFYLVNYLFAGGPTPL
jgi:Dockerin type I domain